MSVARHNPYGHPAEGLGGIRGGAGSGAWRTDRDGAVWVDVDPTQRHLVVQCQGMDASASALLPNGALERENWHPRRRWELALAGDSPWHEGIGRVWAAVIAPVNFGDMICRASM